MENSNTSKGIVGAAETRWPIITPLIKFLKDRFSIIDLANPLATIEGITKDIEFRDSHCGFSFSPFSLRP